MEASVYSVGEASEACFVLPLNYLNLLEPWQSRQSNLQLEKKIVNAVKNQAIDSSIKVAQDLVSGKSVKESLKDEFENVKETAKRKVLNLGTDYLRENNSGFLPKKEKKNPSSSRKKPKLKRKRDIFD